MSFKKSLRITQGAKMRKSRIKTWIRITALCVLFTFIFTITGPKPAFASKTGTDGAGWLMLGSQVFLASVALIGMRFMPPSTSGSSLFFRAIAEPLVQGALYGGLKRAGANDSTAFVSSAVLTSVGFSAAFGASPTALAGDAIQAGTVAGLQEIGRSHCDYQKKPWLEGFVNGGAVFFGSGVRGVYNNQVGAPKSEKTLGEQINKDNKNGNFKNNSTAQDYKTGLKYAYFKYPGVKPSKDPTAVTTIEKVEHRGGVLKSVKSLVKTGNLPQKHAHIMIVEQTYFSANGAKVNPFSAFIKGAMVPGVGYYVSQAAISGIYYLAAKNDKNFRNRRQAYDVMANGLGTGVGDFVDKALQFHKENEGGKWDKDDSKAVARAFAGGVVVGGASAGLEALRQNVVKNGGVVDPFSFDMATWGVANLAQSTVNAAWPTKDQKLLLKDDDITRWQIFKNAYSYNAGLLFEDWVTFGRGYGNVMTGLGRTPIYNVEVNTFASNMVKYGLDAAVYDYLGSKAHYQAIAIATNITQHAPMPKAEDITEQLRSGKPMEVIVTLSKQPEWDELLYDGDGHPLRNPLNYLNPKHLALIPLYLIDKRLQAKAEQRVPEAYKKKGYNAKSYGLLQELAYKGLKAQGHSDVYLLTPKGKRELANYQKQLSEDPAVKKMLAPENASKITEILNRACSKEGFTIHLPRYKAPVQPAQPAR